MNNDYNQLKNDIDNNNIKLKTTMTTLIAEVAAQRNDENEHHKITIEKENTEGNIEAAKHDLEGI